MTHGCSLNSTLRRAATVYSILCPGTASHSPTPPVQHEQRPGGVNQGATPSICSSGVDLVRPPGASATRGRRGWPPPPPLRLHHRRRRTGVPSRNVRIGEPGGGQFARRRAGRVGSRRGGGRSAGRDVLRLPGRWLTASFRRRAQSGPLEELHAELARFEALLIEKRRGADDGSDLRDKVRDVPTVRGWNVRSTRPMNRRFHEQVLGTHYAL